jgi:membrane protein
LTLIRFERHFRTPYPALLAIGPDTLPQLFPAALRPSVTTVVGYAYYPGLVIGLLLLLTTLYKVAPHRKHAWKRGLAGAFLAAVFFLVGALATPITFLLFYYFASMAIILGAQFNNALLEYYPPKPSRRQTRKQRRGDPNRDPIATPVSTPAS